MLLERLRNLREDMDKTQEQMAEYLNCTQASYSYYESGERNLPTDLLIRLAEYYQCSTDYILGITDVKEPYPPREKKKSGS